MATALVSSTRPRPRLFRPAADARRRMNVLDRAARFKDRECTVPNTDIAQAFADVGYLDTAEILYKRDGDERHLARTGQSDQIDRFLVTERVQFAVIDGERLDAPAEAADHCGLRRTFGTALIDTESR